jgi:hypothetical protein
MTLGMVLIILGAVGVIYFVGKNDRVFMTSFVMLLLGMLVTIYPFAINVLNNLQY